MPQNLKKEICGIFLEKVMTNPSIKRYNSVIFVDKMIPGSKGHTFHARMKKYDFGTRKT